MRGLRGENADKSETAEIVMAISNNHIRWEEELEKDEQSALLGEPPLPRRTLRRIERQVNVIISA